MSKLCCGIDCTMGSACRLTEFGEPEKVAQTPDGQRARISGCPVQLRASLTVHPNPGRPVGFLWNKRSGTLSVLFPQRTDLSSKCEGGP